jgi:hypothetical protein
MAPFILSCATTPARIDKLIYILQHSKVRYKYFVINICAEYRRFGKFKVPKSLLQLCKQNKKIIFQFCDDMGPITKLIGGYKFMRKKKLINDKLIIIDDDTFYDPSLFYELMDNKNKDNITTGSGFNYDERRNYIITEGECEMVEGYGGVCFDYQQYNDFLTWYVSFYKHFDFKSENIVDKYLAGSFLGDDYIISNIYHSKMSINKGRSYIRPLQHGFNDDALHKNNVFGSNMGSYLYLYDNEKVFDTFKLKFQLNKEIKNLHSNK